jgi:hypothetical protein
MCQRNDKRIHQKSVKCFRVYGVQRYGGQLTSFYYECDLPQIGVETPMRVGQFHALRSRKAVKDWAKSQWNYFGYKDVNFVIFECVLSKNLKAGVWGDDNTTKTCTGDVLTLVREVGKGYFPPRRSVAGTFELNWTAA